MTDKMSLRSAPRLVPVMVISVPPFCGPDFGENCEGVVDRVRINVRVCTVYGDCEG